MASQPFVVRDIGALQVKTAGKSVFCESPEAGPGKAWKKEKEKEREKGNVGLHCGNCVLMESLIRLDRCSRVGEMLMTRIPMEQQL